MNGHTVVKVGEKIHLMMRRNFDGDLRRHFVGVIIDADKTVVRAEGYVFVFDVTTNLFVKRPQLRHRIVSLIDANNIINIIPAEVALDEVSYVIDKDRRLLVTDKKTFNLDITEFAFRR
jgi:hypothetical protein